LLGWQSDVLRNDLKFGEAWHIAMEHLLLNGYDSASVAVAFDKFLECYREEFPAQTDELFGAKTPDRAMLALAEYSDKYHDDLSLYKVLYTEISGSVPVSPARMIHFRIDAVLEDLQRRFRSQEHKTKGGSINKQWFDQWPMSTQIGTYCHVLNCLYPEADVDGVWVNGAGFLKTKFDFQRLPVKKTREQMQVWLDTTNYWLDRLDRELTCLQTCDANDVTLLAFPCNENGCSRYFGCPYLDFCVSWPNPLRECDEIPAGFKQEFWDPREHKSTIKMELGNEKERRNT